LLFLVCCLGAIFAQDFELRANHVVVHSGQTLEAHLPDESNFQASGGAALGSFGGFTRVIVLLVVLLGVLYHGFVPPAIFGSEAAVRPVGVSLPVRKLSDSQREESVPVLARVANLQSKAVIAENVAVAPVTVSSEIRSDVTQKINKQAAKKLAKKAAKKLLEASKPAAPVEEKKAPTENVVVVEKRKKNKEKSVVANKEKEIVVESVAEKQPIVDLEEEVVLETKAVVKEEELQGVDKSGWVENPPRVFERTSVTIKRAKRMLSIHQLLSVRQARQPSDILDDLDLGSFVVDPRTVNCPGFMKLAAAPLLLEETSPLDIAEQDTPASIEPVRDKMVSPAVVQEFVPKNDVSELAPPKKIELPRDWTFNSHKKTAWMQRQNRAAWPLDAAMPDFMSFGMPWSPIRTPCKFASACKKPGCQFTHPNAIPAWLPAPVF